MKAMPTAQGARTHGGVMDLPRLNCAGCTKCCEGDTITLQPGEPHKRWKTDFNPQTGQRTIRKNPKTGNCIYLRKGGCSIYGKQPLMCRSYDCRVHFLAAVAKDPFAHLSRAGLAGFEEGRARVGALRSASASANAG